VQVSEMLERLFDRLDRLADRYGVYKLDTIGDAYLCATNIVACATNIVADQSADHALALARFAVAAAAAAAATPVDSADPARGAVPLRVGLHSGPCMACVVGRRNPKYTLLGDTVNVASRMESTSAPGRVQCSASTAKLIRAQAAAAAAGAGDEGAVVLEARGIVEVKGKGPMETYWVEGGLPLWPAP
jgi:class 3 adenylate cyclase